MEGVGDISLTSDTMVWKKLDPIDKNPLAQNDHSLIYDPIRDREILLSGNLDGPRSDDTHFLVDLDF